MNERLLRFINSPIGILFLSTCVIGPAGFFISEYRNSLAETRRLEAENRRREEAAQTEAQRRQQEEQEAKVRREKYRRMVFEHCDELFDRNTELRSERDQLLKDKKPVTEIPEIFLHMRESEKYRFGYVSFTQLVYRLEDLTAGDTEFQFLGQRIRRENDAIYNAYRNSDLSEGRRQFSLQNQDLMDCRDKFR